MPLLSLLLWIFPGSCRSCSWSSSDFLLPPHLLLLHPHPKLAFLPLFSSQFSRNVRRRFVREWLHPGRQLGILEFPNFKNILNIHLSLTTNKLFLGRSSPRPETVRLLRCQFATETKIVEHNHNETDALGKERLLFCIFYQFLIATDRRSSYSAKVTQSEV